MMLVQTTAEQLFFVTARIAAASSEKSWVGTGFVYSVPVETGTLHVLVTNKHVLAGASTLDVSMIAANPDGTPCFGRPASVHWTEFGSHRWKGHPDERVDVAVIPYSSVLNALSASGNTPFFRSIDASLSLNAEKLGELDALESVSFVGYPNGIYDPASLLPVMRRGTTATPISIDYRGLPAFLIDGAIYPGSSGSPVFIFDRGMYSTRGGPTNVGTRLILLGILAAVHTRDVTGEVAPLPTRLGVTLAEPLGLGIVFRSEAIETCIDLLLADVGMRRVPAAAPASTAQPSTRSDTAA
jgi:hypothetical protein